MGQYQNWFSKFCSNNFDIKYVPRSGRSEVNKNKIKILVKANWWTTWEISMRLNLSNSIHNHMKRFSFVSKFNIWILHIRKGGNLLRCIDICDILLLKCEENDPFLKQIVIEDEKWIVYDNANRKRS